MRNKTHWGITTRAARVHILSLLFSTQYFSKTWTLRVDDLLYSLVMRCGYIVQWKCHILLCCDCAILQMTVVRLAACWDLHKLAAILAGTTFPSPCKSCNSTKCTFWRRVEYKGRHTTAYILYAIVCMYCTMYIVLYMEYTVTLSLVNQQPN